MIILAVESSCDETAIAITRDGARFWQMRYFLRRICTPFTAALCLR